MMDLRNIKEAKSAKQGVWEEKQGRSHGEQLYISCLGNREKDEVEKMSDAWI